MMHMDCGMCTHAPAKCVNWVIEFVQIGGGGGAWITGRRGVCQDVSSSYQPIWHQPHWRYIFPEVLQQFAFTKTLKPQVQNPATLKPREQKPSFSI